MHYTVKGWQRELRREVDTIKPVGKPLRKIINMIISHPSRKVRIYPYLGCDRLMD
jgi:hypothetical protein